MRRGENDIVQVATKEFRNVNMRINTDTQVHILVCATVKTVVKLKLFGNEETRKLSGIPLSQFPIR